MTKFDLAKQVLLGAYSAAPRRPTVLDVGCRDCVLLRHLKDAVEYKGLDVFQNEMHSVDYVADLERGLPFADESFDFVVALDVVEHVDHLTFVMRDIVRVTRTAAVVVLPNMAFWKYRLTYLFSGSFSRATDKYDLNYTGGYDHDDRHRWLTVLVQTDRYMRNLAKDLNLELDCIRTGWSRGSGLAAICRALRLPESLWVPATGYVLHKRRE